MRRTITTLGAVSLAAALAIGAARPTSADSWQELTGLANIFPANTDIYVGLRTDDAFIETLDGLLARIDAAVPGANIDQSITDMLDQAASSIERGGTFEDTIRPIVGDEAAVAFSDISVLFDDKSDNDSTANYALAFSLNEGGAALLNERIATALASDESYTTNGELSNITIYEPSADNDRFTQPIIYVSETEAVITNSRTMLPLTREARLDSNPALGEAFERLPEDDYNIVVYFDVRGLFEGALTSLEGMSGMSDAQTTQTAQQMEQLQALLGSYSAQVWGFTILDDRALTIDISQAIDPAAYAALGYSADLMARTPIDLAFLERLPAGSALVAQASGLGAALGTVEESFAQMQTPETEQMFQQLNFVLRGATGQDLNQIAAWATGDFAIVTTPLAGLSDPNFLRTGRTEDGSFPVDFGVVIGTSDSAAAQEFAANIASSLTGLAGNNSGVEIDLSEETVEGAEVQVITITTRNPTLTIEILAGANDDVFAIGTRGVITAAFDSAPDLAADPALIEALTYALPDSIGFLYVAGEPLSPLLALAASGRMMNAGDDQVLADLVSSASISATYDAETGASLIRLVWTLPEAE